MTGRENVRGPGDVSAVKFEPGATDFTPAPPEITGVRLAAMLGRLTKFLENQGIVLEETHLAGISSSNSPWETLRGVLGNIGREAAFDELKATVEVLHEEEWRVDYLTDETRLSSKDILEGDDAARYANEWGRLVYREGISKENAHKLMAERGWANPYYADVDPEVVDLAKTLSILKAGGTYTGPLTPNDILAAETADTARAMIEESYEGEVPWEDFEEHIAAESIGGVGETYEESRTYGIVAEDGKPLPPEVQTKDERGPAMGVPEGFSLTVSAPPLLRPNSIGRPGYARDGYTAIERTAQQEPEYWDGAQYQVFGEDLGYETTRLYQTLLLDAGLLSEDDYLAEDGVAGFATYDAMAKAMIQANRSSATSWIEAAEFLAEAEARKTTEDEEKYKEPIPVYTPGVYLKPDPDYLNQVVKQAFRQQLGREPTAEEVSGLIGSLAADFKSEFDVLEGKRRAEFEAEIAAREMSAGPIDPETGERVPQPIGPGSGEPEREGGPTGGVYGVRPGGERINQDKVIPGDTPEEIEQGYRVAEVGYGGTAVDPLASFAERFEALFGAEMARNRYREVSREAFNDVQATIMMMNQAIGGGR